MLLPRRILGHLISVISRHRVLIAVLLYATTWLVGAMVLYGFGYFYGTAEADNGGLRDWSMLHCFYMAAITLTTVGFEEAVDINLLVPEGRDTVLAFLTLYTLVAYIVALYATGSIISFFVEGSLTHYFRRRRMERKLESISDHFVVCGCGTTGVHILNELARTGHGVVGIDSSNESLEHINDHFPDVPTIHGDALDDEILIKARIDRAKGLFAVLPEDRDNILLTVSARQANTELRIVARASLFENEKKFGRVGANAVISPNHIGGVRMASEMIRPRVVDFFESMVRDHKQVVRFEHIEIKAGGAADGKKLKDLEIFGNTGLAVIGIVSSGGETRYNPGGSTVVHGGDALIVVTDPDRRAKLVEMLS